jgi:ribosomal protein S18 acetylase RimI-like enzyme
VKSTRPLLRTIERYYDAVPRAAARVEHIGPFTLFVRHGGGWPYYARPALGAHRFRPDDVERVRARQRALGVPESFEWVAETTPGVVSPVAASGLHVHQHPLQVLDRSAPHAATPPEGITVRLVHEGDDLRRLGAVARVAFDWPGTAAGDVGLTELARVAPDSAALDRDRLRNGLTVTAAAFTPDGDPVAVGSHQPLDGVTEIVGVGTLPAFRRRGIATALTAVLLGDAMQRAHTVFLSAGDADVARVYERLGFRAMATACIAEPT